MISAGFLAVRRVRPVASLVTCASCRKDLQRLVFRGLHKTSASSVKPIAAAVANTFTGAQTADENTNGWYKIESTSLKEKLAIYAKLSKARLTGLVVLTAAAGYAIAPAPFFPISFACTVAGTTLCSAAANTFNQFLEVPYDCQMSRTRDRVLVRGLIRPANAVYFGAGASIVGVSLLSCVNPTVAALGALNIFLYAAVYTPSKRYHIANTWIGSVVGGIPPLMGWAACTGGLDAGAFTLAAILYAWQFPHFNALSWSYRADYSRAGYKMMSVTHPSLCRRVTLRHSLAQLPLAAMLPLFSVTNWWFFYLSLPLNVYLSWLSWRFYRSSNSSTSRNLFRFTLLHLPLLMAIMLVCKEKDAGKNFFERVARAYSLFII